MAFCLEKGNPLTMQEKYRKKLGCEAANNSVWVMTAGILGRSDVQSLSRGIGALLLQGGTGALPDCDLVF